MKPIDLVEETRVGVEADPDIVRARMRGRAIALYLGFSAASATLIATAISELARNILLYAGSGEIQLMPIENGVRKGLAVVASDEGPGMADVGLAMQDGYSTSGRLGLGLPGVRRLMDSFEIHSKPGKGTIITVKKWGG